MKALYYRPFNLHLDFWKSRSVSNLKKISGPAYLDFFHFVTWIFFTFMVHINLFFSRWRPRKKSRFAGPEIIPKYEADLDFSRPWFSEIKVEIKRQIAIGGNFDHFARDTEETLVFFVSHKIRGKPEIFWKPGLIYRTRAIITRGLYFVYPIFHCGLYCREFSNYMNLFSSKVAIEREFFRIIFFSLSK